MTTATSYENVPVFRNGMEISPESIVGKADVEIHQEDDTAVVTMRLGKTMADFLKMGNLKSFGINAMVSDVDTEAAKDWHANHNQVPKESKPDRPIARVVRDVIDNTKIDHLVTRSNAEQLSDELVNAIAEEGYDVT